MDLKRSDGSVYQNVATVSGRCPPGPSQADQRG